MTATSKNTLAITLTGLWVNASEFFRNEVLVKAYWLEHYQSLGLTFPSTPMNGMVWMVWGFLFALAIFIVSRKFDLLQTTLLCWLMVFVLMWIVAWNLAVLPPGLLVYAIPLSLLEAFVGAYLCKKFAP
jgi:ABC-type multidrug transport system fused ATPase/permease subunit